MNHQEMKGLFFPACNKAPVSSDLMSLGGCVGLLIPLTTLSVKSLTQNSMN